MMQEAAQDDVSENGMFIHELVCEIIVKSNQDSISTCEEYLDNKQWLNRKNEENGFHHVDNLMQKWIQLPELKKWSYSIEYVDGISTATLKYHAFQVKWIKPMPGYTHPIIAVNVYVFVKIIEEQCDNSIEMSYNFEGNQYVHDARSTFNPNWLINAYDDKRIVITTLSL